MEGIIRLALTVGLSVVAAAGADSPIAGTWRGRLHDLPAVVLHVTDNGGKVSGSVLFYFLRDDGEGFKVAGEVSRDLLEPKLSGETFTFEVKHDARHGQPGTADPPVRFRMEIVSETAGLLTREGNGQDPPLAMTRGK
jgi:hypothetical protein